MAPEKKLYRARDSLAGGVCAGIADYFNIDRIIVQILTVVFTVMTGGLVVVAYIALWIIVPRVPDTGIPVEVEPHEVRSDTYGQINYPPKQEYPGTQSGAPHHPSNEAYANSAHMPPVPPPDFPLCAVPVPGLVSGVSAGHSMGMPPGGTPVVPLTGVPVPPEAAQAPPEAAQAPPVTSPTSSQAPPVTSPTPSQAQQGTSPTTPQAQQGTSPTTPQPQPQPQPVSHSKQAPMKGILWLGFILLFIGVCALLNLFVRGVHWWQFWPLIFVITGVGQMVVPGKEGHRADHFIGGLMQFAFGATILPFTLGIVAWSSLYTIFAHLWPVLIIMCGFFMLGAATHASVFKLLGGLCFVAFCFCGLLWFSLPGLTEAISLLLPTGQVYVFDFEVGIAPLDFDLRPLP